MEDRSVLAPWSRRYKALRRCSLLWHLILYPPEISCLLFFNPWTNLLAPLRRRPGNEAQLSSRRAPSLSMWHDRFNTCATTGARCANYMSDARHRSDFRRRKTTGRTAKLPLRLTPAPLRLERAPLIDLSTCVNTSSEPNVRFLPDILRRLILI